MWLTRQVGKEYENTRYYCDSYWNADKIQELESYLDLHLVVNDTRRKELIIRRTVSTRRLKTTQRSTKSNCLQQVEDNTFELHRTNDMINTIYHAKASIKSNISTLTTSLQLHTKTLSKTPFRCQRISLGAKERRSKYFYKGRIDTWKSRCKNTSMSCLHTYWCCYHSIAQ